MEKQIKVEYRPVNLSRYNELILLMNSDAFYGDINDIKEKIMDYVTNGGDIEDCYIGEYKGFKDAEMKVKKLVKVELDDKEYDEQEAEFVIYDGSREIDRYSYEQDALEELTRLIEESGREDRYNLGYEPKYISKYDVEIEEDVEILVPDQRVEIEIVEAQPKGYKEPIHMSNEELDEEFTNLMKRIGELSQEMNYRKSLRSNE